MLLYCVGSFLFLSHVKEIRWWRSEFETNTEAEFMKQEKLVKHKHDKKQGTMTEITELTIQMFNNIIVPLTSACSTCQREKV
jgi:hypothetical protein